MNLDSILVDGRSFNLNNFDLIKVRGDDRESFLQGQLTNDLKKLGHHQSQVSLHLNAKGRIETYFYLLKLKEAIFLLAPNFLSKKIVENLEKYIIMDDVELEILNAPITLGVGPKYLGLNNEWEQIKSKDNWSEIVFYGELGIIIWGESITPDEQSNELLELLRRLNGYPFGPEDTSSEVLVNNSRLNELGVDYQKGCFLGQETAAKIESRRGPSTYPHLLELDQHLNRAENFQGQNPCLMSAGNELGNICYLFNYDKKSYLWANIKREYRVENKTYDLEFEGIRCEGRLLSFPFFPYQTKGEKTRWLYFEAVKYFQQDQEELAKSLLNFVIRLDSKYADAYESLGAIYGRHGDFQKGIDLMDQLLKLNPDSVMAHTNKSLYFMKMGKIEEAEEEKSLATLASFKQLGSEAELKRKLEEEKKKKSEEMMRRKEMFEQVLELDQDDLIANFGLADIYFYNDDYSKSLDYVEKALAINKSYSVGYLLKGKNLMALNKKDEAIDTFRTGIEIATRLGELKPANEMQEFLLKI